MRKLLGFVFSLFFSSGLWSEIKFSEKEGPLRLGVVGMTHGHVEGALAAGRRDDIEIVGIWEPNEELFQELASKYQLREGLRFDDLNEMLKETKPEAVSGMTSIAQHVMTVEACAPRGIHVLLEKPLAFCEADAAKMIALGEEYGILVLTNYETSWYASVRELERRFRKGEVGEPRRMVFRHGHSGPKEIGCREEFTDWLLSVDGNGGGASVDFGCYGAVLATWLMDGRKPLEIKSVLSRPKGAEYSEVDQSATIILEYPEAHAVIQASWCWTHDLKEMDLFGTKGSLHSGKWNVLSFRAVHQEKEQIEPDRLEYPRENEWSYLKEVVRGKTKVDPLSSPEFNLTVASILGMILESERE